MPKDEKKSRNVHDARFPRAVPSEPKQPPFPEVELTKEELERLSVLDSKFGGAKASLANQCILSHRLRVNIERFEKQLSDANDKILKLEEEAAQLDTEITDTLRAAATAHGIKLNDPSSGNWSLDLKTGKMAPVPAKSEPQN